MALRLTPSRTATTTASVPKDRSEVSRRSLSVNSKGSRDSKKTIMEVPNSITVLSSRTWPFPPATLTKIEIRRGVAFGNSSARFRKADSLLGRDCASCRLAHNSVQGLRGGGKILASFSRSPERKRPSEVVQESDQRQGESARPLKSAFCWSLHLAHPGTLR